MAPRFVAAAGLLIALSSAGQTVQPPPRDEADRLAHKLVAILETGEQPRPAAARPVETTISEREANAYFHHYGPLFMPAGVEQTRVSIGDRGRLTARAVVNLDAVRKARERGWLDPLAYATGSLEVTAAGTVLGSNGTGVFQFESATVAGVSVSKALLQELVRFYTTSPELPNGFDLDKPFTLPSGIRSVRSTAGTAVIVQ
jgi:hypothetical protein